MDNINKLLAMLAAAVGPPPAQRDERLISEAVVAIAKWVRLGKGLGYEGGLQLQGEVKLLKAKVDLFEDSLRDAEQLRFEMRSQLEALGSIPQVRADLDALSEELRKVGRASLRAPLAPVLMTSSARHDRPVMRFAHPDTAKVMAEFCRDVRFESRDLTPMDDELGGYALPIEVSPEIARMVETVGLAARIGRRVPLGRGGFRKVRRLGGADVYFKTPGAAATESTPTFGLLELKPNTLIALVESDLEFEQDSMVEVGNFLGTEFAYAIARKEDQVAFAGTGTPAEGGITGVLHSDRVSFIDMAAGDDAFADLTYDHLVDLEAAVWDGAQENGRYVMHRTIKALVKKLKDNANNPIWQPTAGDEPSTIMGYLHNVSGLLPGTASTAAETPFLIFGDFFNGLYVGRRDDLRIDYSNEAGFANLQRWWRAYERIDIAVQGYTTTEIAAHPELANPLAVLKTGIAP